MKYNKMAAYCKTSFSMKEISASCSANILNLKHQPNEIKQLYNYESKMKSVSLQ